MTEKKLTKRQEQAIQTKQRIYKVALEYMKNKNFKDVTIEEIAKDAKVSVGTFYYYFSSKEDIYINVFDKMDDELFGNYKMSELFQDAILNFFGQLGECLTELGLNITRYNFFTERTVMYRSDFHMNNVLLKIIKNGQQKGELSNDMSTEEIAEYLLIIVRGVVVDWCVNNAEYCLKEKILLFTKRVLPTVT